MISFAHLVILLVILLVLIALAVGVVLVIWFATGQPARRRAAQAEARAEKAERDTDGLV